MQAERRKDGEILKKSEKERKARESGRLRMQGESERKDGYESNREERKKENAIKRRSGGEREYKF